MKMVGCTNYETHSKTLGGDSAPNTFKLAIVLTSPTNPAIRLGPVSETDS